MIEDFIPKGYENRISRANLRIRTGLPDREIRDLISNAQLRGVMIASDSGGYFQYRDSRDDIHYMAYLKRENSRAKKTQRKNNAMRRAWAVTHPAPSKNCWPGQLSLFEGVM